MKRQTRLYLASASPRRRLLVQALGLPATSGIAPVDEEALQTAFTGPSDQLGEYLARCKVTAAAHALADVPDFQAADLDDILVIGADTTVLLDEQVLGKPADLSEASGTLRRLRGHTHTVVTGVALTKVATSEQRIDPYSTRVATRVTMRTYSDDEIATYVATGDPLDKAGAYAVQHGDFKPVAQIEGCYTAVVGLPLCALAELITKMTGTAPQPQLAHHGYPDAAPPAQYSMPGAPVRCPWSDRCRAPLPPYVQHDQDTHDQAK